jgi:hypothetical protein
MIKSIPILQAKNWRPLWVGPDNKDKEGERVSVKITDA